MERKERAERVKLGYADLVAAPLHARVGSRRSRNMIVRSLAGRTPNIASRFSVLCPAPGRARRHLPRTNVVRVDPGQAPSPAHRDARARGWSRPTSLSRPAGRMTGAPAVRPAYPTFRSLRSMPYVDGDARAEKRKMRPRVSCGFCRRRKVSSALPPYRLSGYSLCKSAYTRKRHSCRRSSSAISRRHVVRASLTTRCASRSSVRTSQGAAVSQLVRRLLPDEIAWREQTDAFKNSSARGGGQHFASLPQQARSRHIRAARHRA